MTNELPIELSALTVGMTDKKRYELKNVINQVLEGSAAIKQAVQLIEVKSINDITSINEAEAARKKVKSMRLNAEKLFDSKRGLVQKLKAEYDTEDKLWLKAKQIMQLEFKEVEEIAEWKANTVKRHIQEQHEIKTHERSLQVVKYAAINRIEYENLSDDNFDMFIKSLKLAFEEKQELERIELEKRNEQIKNEEKERERIKQENEKLRQEQEKIKKENEALKQLIPTVEYKPALNEITIEAWVNSFELDFPKELSDSKVAKDIYSKFHSFKYWAQKQILNDK